MSQQCLKGKKVTTLWCLDFDLLAPEGALYIAPTRDFQSIQSRPLVACKQCFICLRHVISTLCNTVTICIQEGKCGSKSLRNFRQYEIAKNCLQLQELENLIERLSSIDKKTTKGGAQGGVDIFTRNYAH